MKKILFLLAVIGFAMVMNLSAQRVRPPRNDFAPRPVFIKDNCEGARINFGLAFAPTFDWMYTKTNGYSRDGVLVGMRYGVPLNINLTRRKFYYLSTGVFAEQLGGKLSLRDKVVLPDVGETANTEIHRTYRATYLTIPVGITLKSRSLRNFFVCGNAGIYNSLLLNANNTDACLLGGEMWSREKHQYTEAATIRESAYAGLGFEYSVTPTMRAGIMANYVHTFTNFFKGRGQAYNDVLMVDPKANFGCFELELHINFF